MTRILDTSLKKLSHFLKLYVSARFDYLGRGPLENIDHRFDVGVHDSGCQVSPGLPAFALAHGSSFTGADFSTSGRGWVVVVIVVVGVDDAENGALLAGLASGISVGVLMGPVGN